MRVFGDKVSPAERLELLSSIEDVEILRGSALGSRWARRRSCSTSHLWLGFAVLALMGVYAVALRRL
jgi:hypothetical protein